MLATISKTSENITMKNEVETTIKIKEFYEQILEVNEEFSIEEFSNKIEIFQSEKQILNRYLDFYQDKNISKNFDEKRENGMFKVQLTYFKVNDENDIIKYCNNKNISLESYFKNQIKNENNLKIWKKDRFIEEVKRIFKKNVIFEEDKHSTYFWLGKEKSKLFLENIDLVKDNINWEFLSSERNFDWNFENLETAKEYWDWTQICKNKFIIWNFTSIEHFKKYLDWSFVNVYKCLYWTEEQIDKYSEYIFSAAKPTYGSHIETYCKEIEHCGYFETNENVEWSEQLIDKYIDKWDWKYLSQNSSINFSSKQLEKYQNRIDWWWSFFEYGNTNWNEEIFDKFVRNETDWQKLVKNQFIEWNENLFEKYVKNDSVILCIFCEFANIPNELIIKYQNKWNTKVSESGYHRRNSDGTRRYTTFNSLWKYLFKNRNITWDDHLLESCLENIVINEMYHIPSCNLIFSVNFINKYWNYKKEEEWWSSGSYDDYEEKHTSEFRLLDKISHCQINDLTFDDFIMYEIKWYGTLFKKTYYDHSQTTCHIMNPSIKNLLISKRKLSKTVANIV